MPVYQGMAPVAEATAHYDLILTPQLYLMRREKLPVRFAFEARKLAPSILEEMGAQDSWIFDAYPEESGQWILFAYEPSRLERVLEDAGVDSAKIHGIYLAQQFASQLQVPLLLDANKALALVDDTVTELPRTLLQSSIGHQTISELQRPSKTFRLPIDGGNSFWTRSEIRWIMLGLFLLAVSWLAEGIYFNRAAKHYEAATHQLFIDHPTLASSITRRNILDKYRTIDTRQRKIRQTLRKVGRLISRDSQLKEIRLTPQGYDAKILVPKGKLDSLKKLADSVGFQSKIGDGQLEIKGSWK